MWKTRNPALANEILDLGAFETLKVFGRNVLKELVQRNLVQS